MRKPCCKIALLFAAVGCSDVPEPVYPPHLAVAVTATYELGSDRSILVPYSRADLTLFSLEVKPTPVAESFHAGERRFEFSTHAVLVELRCKGRSYSDSVTRIEELFPGAVRVVPH